MPDFAPVWEHLAWASVAEGDSATAERALLRYAGLAGASDTAAAVIGALIHTGFVWRFARERDAAAFSAQLLRDPAIAAAFDLRAAPSYMLTFEVPRATVWLGERFAAGVPRAGLEESGLLAQVYGLVATGRTDSALAVARRLGARTGHPAVALFAAELRRVTKKYILIVDWSVPCDALFGSGDFKFVKEEPRTLGGSFDEDWVPGAVYLYERVIP